MRLRTLVADRAALRALLVLAYFCKCPHACECRGLGVQQASAMRDIAEAQQAVVCSSCWHAYTALKMGFLSLLESAQNPDDWKQGLLPCHLHAPSWFRHAVLMMLYIAHPDDTHHVLMTQNR